MIQRVIRRLTPQMDKKFRIQYVSDIHLEMYDKVPFPLIVKPAARYLALCGDIGHPRQPIFQNFMEYCSQRWDKVFYVPGNHEYYNKKNIVTTRQTKWNIPETMAQIEENTRTLLVPYKNIYYLNNAIVELPDENMNILGTTLWTDIPYEKFSEATLRLNDMNFIANFTPEKMKSLHVQSSSWLMDALWKTNSQGRRAIVLTHHMPSEVLVEPRYLGDRYGYLFYTEMTMHLANPALAMWICGHSHSCARILYRPGVELYMNARGYPDENIEGFVTTAVAEYPPYKAVTEYSIYKEEAIEFI